MSYFRQREVLLAACLVQKDARLQALREEILAIRRRLDSKALGSGRFALIDREAQAYREIEDILEGRTGKAPRFGKATKT